MDRCTVLPVPFDGKEVSTLFCISVDRSRAFSNEEK